jgi:soluble lytic murein transglycosylase-like protein
MECDWPCHFAFQFAPQMGCQRGRRRFRDAICEKAIAALCAAIKRNGNRMSKLTIAAAALAAGLTAFVPGAFAQPAAEAAPKTLVEVFRANAAKKAEKSDLDRTTTASVAPGMAKGVGQRSPYDAIIAKYAKQHGIPLALAHGVVRTESNYRANARGSAGEIGLMQIKPATARGLGYKGSAKGLYDPETNIRYGMKYLAGAHKLGGGDVCGTILRYNAGHAAKRMNKVSAAYCAKVKQFMRSI